MLQPFHTPRLDLAVDAAGVILALVAEARRVRPVLQQLLRLRAFQRLVVHCEDR